MHGGFVGVLARLRVAEATAGRAEAEAGCRDSLSIKRLPAPVTETKAGPPRPSSSDPAFFALAASSRSTAKLMALSCNESKVSTDVRVMARNTFQSILSMSPSESGETCNLELSTQRSLSNLIGNFLFVQECHSNAIFKTCVLLQMFGIWKRSHHESHSPPGTMQQMRQVREASLGPRSIVSHVVALITAPARLSWGGSESIHLAIKSLSF